MSKMMQSIYRQARDSRKPMAERKRYSIEVLDSGHVNYRAAKVAGKTFVIRLDGIEIKGVCTADEVTGYVEGIVLPARLTPDKTELVRFEKRGIVCVDLVDIS